LSLLQRRGSLPSAYLCLVAPPRAFLIDVYDTILTCDFHAHSREVSAIAGVPALAWEAGYAQLAPELMDGRLSIAQGIEQILRSCGADPRRDFVRRLVRRDLDLLIPCSRLYDDVVPFLELLRSRGIKVALVSNCAEGMRALLSELGIATLVDTIVLSWEVGWAKPSPEIYRCALDQLGVAAGAAVFVDDQARFCAGAVAIGMRAAQIVRDDVDDPPEPSSTVVRSLLELETML